MLKTLIFILLMMAEHLSSGHIFIHIIIGWLIYRAILLGEILSVMVIIAINFLEWLEQQERIRNLQETLYFVGMNPLSILNPIIIAKGVSVTCCLLATRFCLLLTIGCHTHCSNGYSTDSTDESS